jgi:hypothetical protein
MNFYLCKNNFFFVNIIKPRHCVLKFRNPFEIEDRTLRVKPAITVIVSFIRPIFSAKLALIFIISVFGGEKKIIFLSEGKSFLTARNTKIAQRANKRLSPSGFRKSAVVEKIEYEYPYKPLKNYVKP